MISLRVEAFATYASTVTVAMVAGASIPLLADVGPLAVALPLVLIAGLALAAVVVSARFYGDPAGPLGLVGMFYFCAFAGGGLYYWIHRTSVVGGTFSEDSLGAALTLAALGLGSLMIGYASNLFRPVLGFLPRVRADRGEHAFFAAAIVVFAVGWIARVWMVETGRFFHTAIDSGTTGSSWFTAVASRLPLLTFAMVTIYGYSTIGRRRRRLKILAGFLALTEVAWALPSGTRADVVGVVVTYILASYYGRARIPRALLIAGAATLIFFVLPFGSAYRGDNVTYIHDPAHSFVSGALSVVQRSPGEIVRTGADATFKRFSDAQSVAAIVERGRKPIAGSSTKTLRWSAEAFVPRALLPTKDDPGLVGSRFAEAYGFSQGGTSLTSVAVTQVGELFLNFGVFGVAIGMVLVGSCYRLIGEYFNHRRHDPVAGAIYAAAAWPLIVGQETIIAGGLIGNVKQIALTTILVVLVMFINPVAQGAGSRLAVPS
jgi:hypothetical protein